MHRMILAVVGRLYCWALVRDLLDEPPDDAPNWTPNMDRRELRRLVWREMAAIRTSIIEHYRYQDCEARILNDRLSRRYDPGLAVNEAAKRAVNAKLAASERSPDNLTDKQKLALKLQEETLMERIRRS